jgi:hypothetical protein
MKLAYKTTINSSPPYEDAVDNDVDNAFVTPDPVYTGTRTPAPGHTVESEAAWNDWWRANFDAVMERPIAPAVGDALGMKSVELRKEIKALRDRVAKLERELEQARADSLVTLPRSAWKPQCGLIRNRFTPVFWQARSLATGSPWPAPAPIYRCSRAISPTRSPMRRELAEAKAELARLKAIDSAVRTERERRQ